MGPARASGPDVNIVKLSFFSLPRHLRRSSPDRPPASRTSIGVALRLVGGGLSLLFLGALPLPGCSGADACADAAAEFAAVCSDDGARACQAAGYGMYCENAVEPEAAAAALDCLRNESSSRSCRTFSDPSGAEACVANLLGPVTRPEWTSIVAKFVLVCGRATTPVTFEPPFAFLSQAQIDAVDACLDGATSCEAAQACLATGPQAPLAVCFGR
ncbi:MAG: hypothetical protein AAFU79_11720 [Myxococcota bacterium]